MKALEFHGPSDLRLVDRADLADPGPDDVLFRPTLAGICGTDRAIYLGHYACTPPRVLGHESVGYIEAVGSNVTRFRSGDRVIMDPTQSCGHCRRCLLGETSHCENKGPLEVGVGRDGAFRNAVVMEAAAFHLLDDALPDRRAVLIEPLACVLSALQKSQLGPSDLTVILGAGPMGALSAMVAERLGSAIVAVEPDGYRQLLLKRLAGIETVGSVDAATTIFDATLVVDTTGVLCSDAMRIVRDGGRVCLMGCNTEMTTVIRPFDLTGRCVSLIGSCDYDSSTFPVAMQFMRTLDCDELVTDEIPLAAYKEAFGMLALQSGAGYQAGKVALRINESPHPA